MTAPIASTSSSIPSTFTPPPPFNPTPSELAAINLELINKTPKEILEWSILNLPNLIQTTAFGLTGLVSFDLLQKIQNKSLKLNGGVRVLQEVPLIFIDTFYHFKETLILSKKIELKYKINLLIFKPDSLNSVEEFEDKFGKELWLKDEDTYDYLVKVEPARRAYAELNVKAVITGRRQSQGADRATLQPIEIDSTGLIKVNPLCTWGFQEVKDYIDMAGVPYNELLDRGYKSVGDWHSTKIPVEGQGERDGRWSGDKGKTECGLHKDYFKMKKAFEKKQRESDMAALDKSRGEEVVGESSVELSLGGLSL